MDYEVSTQNRWNRKYTKALQVSQISENDEYFEDSVGYKVGKSRHLFQQTQWRYNYISLLITSYHVIILRKQKPTANCMTCFKHTYTEW